MTDGLSEMYREEESSFDRIRKGDYDVFDKFYRDAELLKPQQATLLRRSLEIDDDTIPEHRQDGFNALQDAVNSPAHYQGKVECIDAIESAIDGLSAMEGMCTGNAIKYLFRWKRKGGHEDLRKARWYINRILGDN